MTMIISAHLRDCVLIAADKRSLSCNLQTGKIKHQTDEENKIIIWPRGAFAGSGETVFLNRVADYFKNVKKDIKDLRQHDIIGNEIIRRIEDDEIPFVCLKDNIIFFSMFNGVKTLLYSIPIDSFFKISQKIARIISNLNLTKLRSGP